MSLLTLTDVHKSYSHVEILRGVSFFVAPGCKSGLIGANGAGKTTILRLATGAESPDAGRVTLRPNTRTSLLTQEPLLGDTRTVLQAAQRPTPELQSVWAAMTELEQSALDRELHLYDELHHRYQDLGGYQCENRAREVMTGLGLGEDSWEQPVSVLSGGERTRLALAQVLVWQPDLLLLDEPTNHLDWQACEWLQEYLGRYPGAALMVSHDRYFLDQTAEEIIALDQGQCRTYRGNYGAFVRKRAQEREQAEEHYRRQQEEIERQQAIVQRMRSHRNYSGMHSRERVLEKLETQFADRPRRESRPLKIRAGATTATGREVLTVRDLEHGFGGRKLFAGLNLTLERGERLGVIGPNGSGKTTLLRVLAGEIPAVRGAVSYGYHVQPAYFAQDLSSLDPESTVWSTLWDTGAFNQPETMQSLHQFGFFGQMLERRVADLSGGERTRLALCRLLADRPNLLMLDEPTNHLDLESREAVESGLRKYPGALVVVSHDRYLLEAVATRLLEIRPGVHRLFDGGYRRYRETFPAVSTLAAPARKSAASPTPTRTRPISATKRLSRLEREIAGREERQREITASLAEVATWRDAGAAGALQAEYDRLTLELEALCDEWAEVAEVVERAGDPG